jgi:glycosyltransferase involved in cell wall biosynthesis
LHDTAVLDKPDLFDAGYAMYARALFGWSVRRADEIIVPSHYTADCARGHWGSQLPITVAHWPVEISGTTARQLPEDKTVLVVGASEPHKRQELAIAAVAKARKITGVDLKLELLGPGGSFESRLRDLILRADVAGSWIRRRRDVPHKALQLAYANAWVLLQPSLFEGYGLPVAEAASGGLPTLHSSAGALDEVAPSERGTGDGVDGYVAGLVSLLDAAQYRAASVRARRAAASHTNEAFCRIVLGAVASAAPFSH